MLPMEKFCSTKFLMNNIDFLSWNMNAFVVICTCLDLFFKSKSILLVIKSWDNLGSDFSEFLLEMGRRLYINKK